MMATSSGNRLGSTLGSLTPRLPHLVPQPPGRFRQILEERNTRLRGDLEVDSTRNPRAAPAPAPFSLTVDSVGTPNANCQLTFHSFSALTGRGAHVGTGGRPCGWQTVSKPASSSRSAASPRPPSRSAHGIRLLPAGWSLLIFANVDGVTTLKSIASTLGAVNWTRSAPGPGWTSFGAPYVWKD
jgi:hypothetical protein